MKKKKITPEELVKEYGELISSLCYRMISDKFIAEEAAQEVWYEIIKSLDTFKGEADISTWIYTIANRVIKNYACNEKLYDTGFLKFCFDGPDVRIPDEVDYDKKLWIKEMCDRCLTAILQCLNLEKRLAYILRDGAQLPYKTIAKIMDKKEATVRKIVSRARKKLKNFLNNQCTLYNPEGDCNCRIKKLVEDINLAEEYEKIDKIIDKASFYAKSDKILPGKNYWKKFL